MNIFVPFNPDSTRSASRWVGWVVAENGCHLWQGATGIQNRGVVWDGERLMSVTRVRYLREVGPIPDGMFLDHYVCSAGHLGCCNPFHVRPVSVRENTLRGDTLPARNAAKTHCKRGHELASGNLCTHGLSIGQRICLVCKTDKQRRRRRASGVKPRFAGTE